LAAHRAEDRGALPVSDREAADREHDPVLQLRETTPGVERAAFGGVTEKVRLHDLNLARVTSLRLGPPEPVPGRGRWAGRQPLGEDELERRERMGLRRPS